MGTLQLLDWLGAVYFSPKLGFVVFSLSFSLLWPMALCMVVWVVVVHRLGMHRCLLAVAPIVLVLLNSELAVSLATLLMSVVGAVWVVGRARFLDSSMLVLMMFNGLAVLHLGVLVPLGVSGSLAEVTRLQVGVHFLIGWLVPLTVYVFLFFWLLKPFAGQVYRLAGHRVEEGELTRLGFVLLVFSIYLSLYVSLYPYFPAVNPRDLNFGVDIARYIDAIGQITGSGKPFQEIMVMGRGFFFVFFFAFQRLTGLDVVHAARLVPALLNPLFVFASFLFAWECFRNFEVAAWCSFFASTGNVVALGTGIYLVSNTLALVMALFSFTLLFKAIRLRDRGCLLAASFLGSLLVFTHPWTMDQYMAAALCSLAYFWLMREGGRAESRYLLTYLAVVGLAELLVRVLSVGVSGTSSMSVVVQGVLTSSGVWSSTLLGFFFLNGGLTSNLVLMCLAIVGIYVMGRERPWGVFLFSLVFLSSLVFFFGDGVIKTRLIYNIPLNFFAAIGLNSIKKKSSPFLLFFVVAYSLFYVFIEF